MDLAGGLLAQKDSGMRRTNFALTQLAIWVAAIGFCVSDVSSHGQQRAQKSTAAPLKLEQVSDMVESGLNSVDILVEAKARGLAFVAGANVIQDLERRGADALLLNWLGLYSVELQTLYARALSAQRERQYERVIEVCGDLLSKSPRLLHIYLIRGAAYRARKQFDKGADDFRQALKFHPNSSRARVLLAETLIASKQTEEAIRELNWVIDHRSAASVVDWPTAHVLLAGAYLQDRNYRQASQELHTALWQSPAPDPEVNALLPDLANPMSELARLLALCPDQEIAAPAAALELATLLKLMAANPQQEQTALLRLAEAQAATGNFGDAVATQKSAEIIKGGVDAASFADRLKQYQKKQLALLPAGSAPTATPEGLPVDVTPSSLLARMKRIDPAAANIAPADKSMKPFLMSKYEVTLAEWASVMEGPAPISRDLPVDRVSWEECQTFLKKLNQRMGSAGPRLRLPTLAEFRLASHHPKIAASGEPWQLHQEAWYAGSGGQAVHRVGLLRENAAGLHDVLGNVAEWCADDVDTMPMEPQKSSGPAYRIAWGGSYLNSDTQCLSTTGTLFKQNEARRGLGLRLAADVANSVPGSQRHVTFATDSNIKLAGISRALEAARSALEQEPFQRGWLREKLLTLMYLQACVRVHMHDLDQAVVLLRAIIRESPEEGTALIQLARCHLAWIQSTRPSPAPDQLAEAHKVVEVALTRSEFRSWIAYLSQSAVLVAAGKLEDAVRRANQALDLAPTQFKALCVAQLEAIRDRKQALSAEFPVSPKYSPSIIVTDSD